VITIDISPMIHLGPLMLSWYGIIVAIAAVTGVWLTLREAERRGIGSEPVMDIVLWIFLGALVGARLLHVIDRWGYYAENPAQIIAIQNGGLAIIGGILGGALTGGLLAWKRGLPVLRLFDAAAPGLILGQAIGRFGCLITGDSVGQPTNAAWGIVYLNPGAMVPQLGVAYQPVFMYEQAWDILVFGVLWLLRKRLRVDGRLFAIYIGLYAAGKFALTFLRTETIWFLGLQEAQIFALGLVATSILVWNIAARRATPELRPA
jgi:phosphatidylglycerol---prolipoprotein diacylglyceryl transferase